MSNSRIQVGDLIRSWWIDHVDWGLGVVVSVPDYEDYIYAAFPHYGVNLIYVDEIEVISSEGRIYLEGDMG
jgi:hypothetical protein